MSRMFDSYNVPEEHMWHCNESCFLPENHTDLYDIKGRQIGVAVKHEMPFKLYFHIDELNNLPFVDFILQSEAEFKLLTKSHKVALTKTISCTDIYDVATGDLMIEITQDEAKSLKQESYGVELKLNQATGFYKIFTEADGLLVVR